MEQLLEKVDVMSRAIIQPDAPHLSDIEAKLAEAELSKPFYSRLVRVKRDPQIGGQVIGLISFTPSRNARPDEHGVYGVAKLRGNYANTKDAAVAAEQIIREVDSVNEILHVRVGETFPLTKETKWVEKFDSVNLSKHVDSIQKEKQLQATEEDEKERKVLLDREKKLLDENKEILTGSYKEDPLDMYIRLNVARAQLKWSKADVERKVNEEIAPAIEKRNREIAQMDEEYPEFKQKFLEKYMDARRDACLDNNIPEDHEKVQQGFLKYLVEDK